MTDWRQRLKFDPLPPLLAAGDEALRYFTRRDLLGEEPGPIRRLWQLPGALKLLKKQLPDGSWPRPAGAKHPAINYHLIETWRQFRFLVEQYGFTREHPAARAAAEFLFTCQTDEGDIRGILANQYVTYYTGAIMALLIQSGYADDPRIEKGFRWLLAMRQNDGGWTIPILTHKLDRATQYRLTSEHAEPLQPDRARPFSHNWTGMVLRAFAAHPVYRRSEAAWTAANLLKTRFFQPDAYSSYRDPGYWVRFEYPFWWNNLVAALDSLSLIGLSIDDPDLRRAVDWLVDHQLASGLWRVTYAKADEKDSPKTRAMQLWVTLAICRVLKRLHNPLGQDAH
jgi:hypothetical protein